MVRMTFRVSLLERVLSRPFMSERNGNVPPPRNLDNLGTKLEAKLRANDGIMTG